MQKLLKNGALTANPWQIVSLESFEETRLETDHLLLPLDLFLTLTEKQALDFERCGPILSSADDVKALKRLAPKLTIVALNFEQFMDGRGFSQARILREQLDYTGEIRAIGGFIIEQMFYLARCGVDSFLLPEDTQIEEAQKVLLDFSDSYQASSDESQPLFRRRV